MKDLFDLLGHDAELFVCAEDFLRYGRIDEVSCIVTDVKMFGMSGVQLYGKLREDGRRMPIIFVTAFPQDTVRRRLLKEGVAGYLTKPLRIERFIECLNSAIGPGP